MCIRDRGWAAWKFPLVCSGAMTGEQTYFWAGYEGATFTLFRGAGFPIGLALLALAITALALLRWPAALPGARPLLALAAPAAAGFVAGPFLPPVPYTTLPLPTHAPKFPRPRATGLFGLLLV